MRFYFMCFLLCFSSSDGLAQNCNFMVIAQSGVNLRQKPEIKSDVITKIPFGDYLVATSDCQQYNLVDAISIDNKQGVWIEVNYKGKQGYVFSAFIMNADYFYIKQNDSTDCVILDQIIAGDYSELVVDTLDYHYFYPGLNWHKVSIGKEKFTISPTVLNFQFNPLCHFNSDKEFPLQIKTLDTMKFSFLIGTKKKLPIISKEFQIFNNWIEDELGLFIYPGKSHHVNNGCGRLVFKGEIYTIKGDTSMYYDLNLYDNNKRIEIKNKSENLHIFDTYIRHGIYSVPKLYWQGDLNDDCYPDFFFIIRSMSDNCGSIPYLQFLYSKTDNLGKVYYESNKERICFDSFEERK